MEKKYIVVTVSVLVLVITGYMLTIDSSSSTGTGSAQKLMAEKGMMDLSSGVMETGNEVKNTTTQDDKQKVSEMMNTEDMMSKDGQVKGSMDTQAVEKGIYKDYSTEGFEAALEAGKKTVLFFHAASCPYCIAADKDFVSKSLSGSLPQNVILLKVDYDSQKALKEKYGVTTQHTFVQIDKDGKEITKWISGESAMLSQKLK